MYLLFVTRGDISTANSDQYEFVTCRNRSAAKKAKFDDLMSDISWHSLLRMDRIALTYRKQYWPIRNKVTNKKK